MSGDNEVSVKVAANTGELKPGMEAAANAVKSSVEQMRGSFAGLEGVLAGIQSHILAFTAVMAGGALFGSSIKAANDWNSEVTKISKTMGMTTEQASIMAVALDHIGVSTDTFTHASTMLTRQLSGNEGAFRTLGVATRDANTGAFRPTGDIMVDVNEKLKSIQNTTERNAAGMKIYGRSWEEVRTILKLTPEAMKEAEETAKRLHLIVGPEGTAMTRKYKEEMRDFHLILNSLSIQIGNALLPVMMKLGAFMGEEGPAMGDVFKKVIQSIAFAAGAAWLPTCRYPRLMMVLLPMRNQWLSYSKGWRVHGTPLCEQSTACQTTRPIAGFFIAPRNNRVGFLLHNLASGLWVARAGWGHIWGCVFR